MYADCRPDKSSLTIEHGHIYLDPVRHPRRGPELDRSRKTNRFQVDFGRSV